MSDISGALGVNGTGGSNTQAAKEKIGDTFDNFLTLLTTQLQNQDPLSPMESNEFTEQLVHFTNVEQAIAQNEKLDELLALGGFNRTAQAVGFIGKQVAVEDSFMELGETGGSSMQYTLAEDAARARISIVDLDGNLVRSLEAKTEAGTHTASWDGLDENGDRLESGIYAVLVSAINKDEAPVDVTSLSYATVKGVSSDDQGTWLDIGEAEVALDNVKAIREPGTDTSDTSETED
jgi:flagellar basal-body rod modification protein FlgD